MQYEQAMNYETHVSNIGMVYAGTDEQAAHEAFNTYVELSRTGYGRAAHEDVTLFGDGEVLRDFVFDPADYFEIVDHGVEHSQYFRRCGVSRTKYDSCVTGIGDTPLEALEDALQCAEDMPDWLAEMIEQSEDYATIKASTISVDAQQREELGLGEDDDLPDCREVYYHISIRYITEEQ